MYSGACVKSLYCKTTCPLQPLQFKEPKKAKGKKGSTTLFICVPGLHSSLPELHSSVQKLWKAKECSTKQPCSSLKWRARFVIGAFYLKETENSWCINVRIWKTLELLLYFVKVSVIYPCTIGCPLFFCTVL